MGELSRAEKMRKTLEERFWSKLTKTDGCWEWAGYIDEDGYGIFKINGNPLRAHRISYLLLVGPIPPGLLVCHKCDNRKCVNPDHLFLGTHLDNSIDCIKKGRRAKHPKQPARPNCCGEKIPSHKLTNNQVIEIRSLLEVTPVRKLARMYHVAPITIRDIKLNRSWKHLIDLSS
jgi:hypothetical protein